MICLYEFSPSLTRIKFIIDAIFYHVILFLNEITIGEILTRTYI